MIAELPLVDEWTVTEPMEKPITCVLSGLIYPVTMLHYFWRAFERRDDVNLIVTGPFFGSWIPWRNGMFLPEKYVKYPHFPLPKTAASFFLDPEMLRGQVPDDVDLWIECDAGWRFSRRPWGDRVVQIQTDPHVLKDQYRKVRDRYDVSYCMQTPYQEADEIWLPYGFDPELHYPMNLKKEHDVCLIGLQYDKRMQVLNYLRNKYNVKDGIGIVYDEYREEYNKSRVAFSWASLLDTPARVFEAMAMGIPLVSNRCPDLMDMFDEGTHFLGFDTVTGAIEKIEWAINNQGEALEMAASAFDAVTPHTWDARVQTILETCGL